MREEIRANKFSPAFYILTAILVFNSTLAFAQRPPLVPINLSNLRIDFMNVGARPAALGGAFIAAAQDETAGPINPAGLTYLESAGASLHQRRTRDGVDLNSKNLNVLQRILMLNVIFTPVILTKAW